MSNSISFVGNIGKDAETRQAGSTTVTSFNVANPVGFGDRKQTLWMQCSIWGKQGERLQQHLTKGSKVFISGELSTREYNDKTYMQVDVKSFDFAGQGGQGQQSNNDPPVPENNGSGTGENLPF